MVAIAWPICVCGHDMGYHNDWDRWCCACECKLFKEQEEPESDE